MFFHRAFPYELPEEFISVLDKTRKEHGIIRRISDFDEESAAIIARSWRGSISRRISRRSTRQGAAVRLPYWEVESDRGPLSFAITTPSAAFPKSPKAASCHRRRRQPLRDRRRARSRQQKLPQARAVPPDRPAAEAGRKGSVFPMSDTSQTPYTGGGGFAARVSKEAGAEAVFVFAYNLTLTTHTPTASRQSPEARCTALRRPIRRWRSSTCRPARNSAMCSRSAASIEYESGAAAELLRTRYAPRARVPERGDAAARALSEGRTVSAEPSVSAPAVRSAAGRFRAEAARSAALRRPQKAAAPALAVCKAEPEAAAGRRCCFFSPSARSTC